MQSKLQTKTVAAISHLKVRILYGVEIVSPAITLFTAVGVAKVAWGIPAWIAGLVMLGSVFVVGAATFRMGIFGKDRDIQWRETPMANEILDALKRLEARE